MRTASIALWHAMLEASHFFPFLEDASFAFGAAPFFDGLRVAFTSLERRFLASMSLNLSKSVMFLRTSLDLIFFAHAVADHLFMISSALSAVFRVFSRAPRGIFAFKSVRLRRAMGIICRRTPVSGPSTMTRFWSTMSMITHIFPSHGPYVMSAKRPGSMNLENITNVLQQV